jgi:hypothetical protein
MLLAAFCAASAFAQNSTQSADPKEIDVDAMARAKDAQANPSSTPAPAAKTDAPASPPSTQPAPPAQTDAPASPPSTQPAPPTQADDAASGRPAPLAPPSNVDKERAATCTTLATHLLDAAQKADYATATRDFDERMHEGLPPDKFKQMWESLPPRFGVLQARGQSHAAMDQGYIAISIPLIFEKANLYAQIACGADDRIAGFYVKPLPAPGS